MTEQESMEIIMQVAYDGEFPLNSNEAFGIACKCIEKQIPKKPKRIEMKYANATSWYPTFCPICFEKLKLWDSLIDKGTEYCRRCGQKIDWEEVEE